MNSMSSLNSAALKFLAASSKLYPQLDALATEICEIENAVGDAGFRRVVSVDIADGKRVSYCKSSGGWGVRIVSADGAALNWEETGSEEKMAIGFVLEEFVRAITKEMVEMALERERAATHLESALQSTPKAKQ